MELVIIFISNIVFFFIGFYCREKKETIKDDLRGVLQIKDKVQIISPYKKLQAKKLEKDL